MSRSDPRSLAVDFGALPNHADQARQQAAAQAAMLRGEPPVVGGRDRPGGLSTDNPFTGTKAQFAGGTAADLPPEALARLEEALGIDLDGNGVVGGKPSPSPDRATNGKGTTKDTDSDERLRRLAQLHSLYKDGALTAEEFASEKRRLLED